MVIQGAGGQLDYFGLWLSAEFGVGHSKAKPKCTTYSSPMLSSSEDFVIDSVEVWGVGTPKLPEVSNFICDHLSNNPPSSHNKMSYSLSTSSTLSNELVNNVSACQFIMVNRFEIIALDKTKN